MIEFKNTDALSLLKTISDNSINLVLIDPPYIISKKSGMQAGRELVKAGVKHKNLQLSVQTDFGEWDKLFTIELLNEIVKELFRVLKKGGTVIIFFDLWKISELKTILDEANFKQLRFIEWIKTNPVPINSKLNYLSNAREMALTAVKGGKPTFNSEYDNGIYNFGIQQGNRIHPTQKSLKLFEELIKKHSNEGDLVLDCFAGSATTTIAAINQNRNFIGCEIDKNYFDLAQQRIDELEKKSNKDLLVN
jgi:site-specific DNA-methyltransferase (adenine-specific)